MYIVSKENVNGEFHPSVPENRLLGEDGATPRVRVFRTLEGAFSGLEEGGEMLKWSIEENAVYCVYEFDWEEAGVRPEDKVGSVTLVESLRVPDADITGEEWVLKAFTVPISNRKRISLKSWTEREVTYAPFIDPNSFLSENMGVVIWIGDIRYEVIP